MTLVTSRSLPEPAARPRTRLAVLFAVVGLAAGPAGPAKEFLTPAEITKIQDAPEVDKRIKVYLDAAALRLKTAEERCRGKESEPGDPLELFRPEDMVEGYVHILRSVMFTLDEAAERPKDPARLVKALKNLRESTERDLKSLAILKTLAEEKHREELWNLLNRALEIADGARDGAETGLARFQSKEKPKR